MVYSNAEMIAHGVNFNKQLLFRFNQKRKKKLSAIKSRGLRSSILDDLDGSAESVWSTSTTFYNYLSRYLLEDMLACDKDCKFLLCLQEIMEEDEYHSIILGVAIRQGLCGTGGEKCNIFECTYYCLRATMQEAKMHHNLICRTMSCQVFWALLMEWWLRC